MGRTFGWLIGGILVASGILNLLFSFGTPWGDIALSLDRVGFDAVDDLAPYSRFTFSIVCFLLGIPTLVGLNATQWKNTGGY